MFSIKKRHRIDTNLFRCQELLLGLDPLVSLHISAHNFPDYIGLSLKREIVIESFLCYAFLLEIHPKNRASLSHFLEFAVRCAEFGIQPGKKSCSPLIIQLAHFAPSRGKFLGLGIPDSTTETSEFCLMVSD